MRCSDWNVMLRMRIEGRVSGRAGQDFLVLFNKILLFKFLFEVAGLSTSKWLVRMVMNSDSLNKWLVI